MKKMFAIVMALCLISSQAFAVTYTVSSTEKYRDSLGNNKIRVQGTIAFDSSYNCNTTTGQCGESIEPSQIGMESISRMSIDPMMSTVAGGVLIAKYHATGLRPTGGAGDSGGNIRLYQAQSTGLSQLSLASAPTYNLALVTALPFEAVGA